MTQIATWLFKLRNRHFLLLDLAIFLLTPTLALLIRTEWGTVPVRYTSSLIFVTLSFLAVKVLIFYLLRLYKHYWRYASIDELGKFVLAAGATLILQQLLFHLVLRPSGLVLPSFPRSLPIIEVLLSVPAAGAIRYSVRLAERLRQRTTISGNARRVIVVGAGQAGVMIVKEMQANPQLKLYPVAFVDDDPTKHNAHIRGIPVLGSHSLIPALVRRTSAKQVIIAMPRAPGKLLREILALCEQANISAKTIPSIYELLNGTVTLNQLRNVQIEDLLRREPIQTDIAAVHDLIHGKRVLVTGGGGSIGSEICRQILRWNPSELIIIGHGENSIFEIRNELQNLNNAPPPPDPQYKTKQTAKNGHGTPPPTPPHPQVKVVIADIRFPERIRTVFAQHQPQIVFHAAAHKHVPLMEENPAEAITNNILGTRNVLDAALSAAVERFVMISTDKAVNPTSVMGASKRVAELLVHQVARASGKPYVAVRFGNVLGSRGSVVLTFKQQIAQGGPVTVTDPEMSRFFMTIPEAVQLVLQAAVLGEGGEVFLLDMGEPVKIVDLARDLIELSGLEVGKDIDIVFTGTRPGEKLYEELFVPGEDYHRTRHEKIFIAANASNIVPTPLDDAITALETAAQHDNQTAIIQILKSLVPEYQPQPAPTNLRGTPRLTAEVVPHPEPPPIQHIESIQHT